MSQIGAANCACHGGLPAGFNTVPRQCWYSCRTMSAIRDPQSCSFALMGWSNASELPPDKNRPPSLTGAKLPWFSRCSRAFLAAYGGVAVGAEKCLGGGATDLRPLRTSRGSHTLGLWDCLGRQTVFHQPHTHTAGPDGLIVLIGLPMGVAKGHCVHAVDGNLMFCYQITLDRLGQPLLVLNADAACAG